MRSKMTEHDELIGLLRGFQVGDKVVVHGPGNLRHLTQKHNPYFKTETGRKEFEWLCKQQYVSLVAVSYPTQQYRVDVQIANSLGFWLFEDEISHYYAD
jgi:hypothetical protein